MGSTEWAQDGGFMEEYNIDYFASHDEPFPPEYSDPYGKFLVIPRTRCPFQHLCNDTVR
jgi:hypothetical protein